MMTCYIEYATYAPKTKSLASIYNINSWISRRTLWCRHTS